MGGRFTENRWKNNTSYIARTLRMEHNGKMLENISALLPESILYGRYKGELYVGGNFFRAGVIRLITLPDGMAVNGKRLEKEPIV